MELVCSNLQFSYVPEREKIIRNVSLRAVAGQPIWIRGRSGTGKSTLLKLLSGLLTPDSGEIKFDNIALSSLSDKQRAEFRRFNIGFVHQENHLIEHWTVEQNLNLVSEHGKRQRDILRSLNFDDGIMSKLVSAISGGERQRISLARLILQNPKFVFIDEPTSHLDDLNFEAVVNLLNETFADKVLIYVSHDRRFETFSFSEIDFSEINK